MSTPCTNQVRNSGGPLYSDQEASSLARFSQCSHALGGGPLASYTAASVVPPVPSAHLVVTQGSERGVSLDLLLPLTRFPRYESVPVSGSLG